MPFIDQKSRAISDLVVSYLIYSRYLLNPGNLQSDDGGCRDLVPREFHVSKTSNVYQCHTQ